MAGLLSTGFSRKRLPEIQEELRTSFADAFGNIDTGPASRFGQIIGILSEREDRIWQLAEAVYLSQYPSSAAGRSLSQSVMLNGLSRLPATRTTAIVSLIGDPATVVPAGSQISNAETGDVYETLAGTTISASTALQAQIEVEAQDSTTYTVTLNGTPYTHNSGVGEDAEFISAELASSIDAVEDFDATSEGAILSVVSGDRSATFSISVTGPLTITELGSAAQVRALVAGRRLAPAGTLTSIENPVSGWTAVTNYLDATPGRDTETDSELRIRRQQSLRIAGGGTVEGIRARLLQDVEDVTAVSIIENRTDEEDADGRPPHSYEAIVTGGTDEDIADNLWESKPAGIETTGDITVVVTDSQGGDQTIKFSRPIDVYIWVRMDVNINGVGAWPDDGEDAIKGNIVAYGQTLSTGDDVIFQALFGPIYQVPGIESVSLEIARTAAPEIEPEPGDWVSANIEIGAREQALWSVDRIEVTLV